VGQVSRPLLGLLVSRAISERVLVKCGHLEQIVVGQMLEGKLPLAGVPRVGLPEHGVTVAGHYLSALEGLPDEGLELLVAGVLADLLAQLHQPDEHFLVGEAVEGPGEAVHAGGEREVRIGEGRADEVGRVRRHVATLVIRVDGQVEAQQLDELGVVEAEHRREIVGPVLARVHRADALAVLVEVPTTAKTTRVMDLSGLLLIRATRVSHDRLEKTRRGGLIGPRFHRLFFTLPKATEAFSNLSRYH
jgi:hypothetical protein